MTKEKLGNSNLTTNAETGNNPLVVYKDEFDRVFSIISAHKRLAMSALHNESLCMLWEVGAYVSDRLKKAAWGDGVVRLLADYIRTRSPKAKGWSYRTIYKMVQFHETYSTDEFLKTVSHYGLLNYLNEVGNKGQFSTAKTIVPIESAQIKNEDFVPIESTQIPSVLFATGWSNHQLIMSRCKTDEQRLFYMLYAGREQLQVGSVIQRSLVEFCHFLKK